MVSAGLCLPALLRRSAVLERRESDLGGNRKRSPSMSGLPLRVFGEVALDTFQKGD